MNVAYLSIAFSSGTQEVRNEVHVVGNEIAVSVASVVSAVGIEHPRSVLILTSILYNIKKNKL